MRPDQFMNNEEMRWSYMTEEQLARRLKKITREGKLQCFIEMASLHNNDYLHNLAVERQVDLGHILQAKEEVSRKDVSAIGTPVRERWIDIKEQVAKKWNVTKEKEIDDRYVDF